MAFFHHSSVATSLASSSRSGKHWWIFIAFSFINNNHFSREKNLSSIAVRCACLTRVICCARRNNTEKFHQFFSSLQIHIFLFLAHKKNFLLTQNGNALLFLLTHSLTQCAINSCFLCSNHLRFMRCWFYFHIDAGDFWLFRAYIMIQRREERSCNVVMAHWHMLAVYNVYIVYSILHVLFMTVTASEKYHELY